MADPASYADLVLASLMDYIPTYKDIILNANPLFYNFRKDGRIKPMIGRGRVMPVIAPVNATDAANTNAKFMAMSDQIDLNPRNVLAASQWYAKFAQETNGMWLEEEIKNKPNKTRIVNIVEARKAASVSYMTNLLGAKSFAATVADDSMDSIPEIVADNPASGTVGGINRATASNGWWKNQSIGLQAFAGTGVTPTPTIMFACMRAMHHAIEDVMGKTSSIYASTDYYEMYAQYLEDKKLITSQEQTIDGGFTALKFMGIPMYRDRNIAAGHMYFLDEKSIYLGVTEMEGESTDGFKFLKKREPADYHKWVIPCTWDGTIMCDNARTQGVIH